MSNRANPTRRSFLRASAAAAALPWFGRTATARTEARLPGDPRLRVAQIGVGGMGGSDLGSVASSRSVDIVALCDVDSNHLAEGVKRFPSAKPFHDYRRLLDELADGVDAVVVSTPDHMHGSIAIAAMERGKHVYCQKPIAHNLVECRRMAEIAAERGLVTQMGTQIHSLSAYRTAVASLRSGIIGKVSEAHLWVSRSWAGPAGGRPDRTDPIPTSLDWDLWLGVAQERPFVEGIYHPGNWRGWRDFGGGTLGDMGCHIFDPVFSGLGLRVPTSVVSRGPAHGEEVFAADGDITYQFPGTEFTTETLQMRWTDGSAGSRPDAAKAQLPDGVSLPGAGSFLVGEKGVLVLPHWADPKVYLDGKELPVELTVREGGDHYHEWVDACLGKGTTSTPFAYSGPLTEAVLIGTIAGAFPDRELSFDPATLRFDAEDADALVSRSYRDGWEIAALR